MAVVEDSALELLSLGPIQNANDYLKTLRCNAVMKVCRFLGCMLACMLYKRFHKKPTGIYVGMSLQDQQQS